MFTNHTNKSLALIVGAGLTATVTAQPALVPLVPDWPQPIFPTACCNAPGGAGGDYGAYCVPTAAANVIGLYRDTYGVAIADPLPYPNYLGYGSPNFRDDLVDGFNVPRQDLGWHLDTNGLGVGGVPHRGTFLSDVEGGLGSYFDSRLESVSIRNYGGPAPSMPATLFRDFDTTCTPQIAHTDAAAYAEIRREIDAGRPLLGHWTHGHYGPLTPTGNIYEFAESTWLAEEWLVGPPPGSTDDETGEPWDPDLGLGHTMTIVGYWTAAA
ncbi:MAG: hypothetical protein ACYTGP_10945, partial [Planctomycetota bacterium]